MKLPTDLREFIELMNSHGVEYLIVGGHAVGFHGYPRYTGDIDFFIRPSTENAQRVSRVLEEFGFPKPKSLEPSLVGHGHVIGLGRPPNRIDLLTAISGLSFEEAWESREQGRMDDLPVHFIGKSALLKNKRASGRTKDLADAEELQNTRP